MQAWWAMPFMTPDKADSPPRGFTTSFTVVPLLTYFLATCIVLWIWGISSHYVRDYLELTVRELASAAVRGLKSVFGYAKETKFPDMQMHRPGWRSGFVEDWTPEFMKNWKFDIIEDWTPGFIKDSKFGIIENWNYSLNRWKLERGLRKRRRDQESRI